VEKSENVILKPFFWAKDLRECLGLELHQRGSSTLNRCVYGEKAKLAAFKTEISPEILRPKEGLQDDRSNEFRIGTRHC
jgi:hypothetical protein